MRLCLLLFTVVCCSALAGSVTTSPAHHAAAVVLHAHSKSAADGHYDEVKQIKKTGKESKHVTEAAQKGNHGAISHKIGDEEKALKKTLSHGEAYHQSHKKAAAHEEHGAKFDEGAQQKKTGYSKGFHEKYHKNEHKKHDSFYSHGKKSGDFETFGAKNSKHAGHKVDKIELKNKATAKSSEKHGKANKKASGHKVEDHKAHKGGKGKKTAHHEKQQQWAKKLHKPADKQKYKYSQVHH